VSSSTTNPVSIAARNASALRMELLSKRHSSIRMNDGVVTLHARVVWVSRRISNLRPIQSVARNSVRTASRVCFMRAQKNTVLTRIETFLRRRIPCATPLDLLGCQKMN
jgi:hypothetical protein